MRKAQEESYDAQQEQEYWEEQEKEYNDELKMKGGQNAKKSECRI